METAKKVAIVVLLSNAILLRDGIEDGDQKKLKSVSDQNLFRVLEYQSVVWHTPASWIEFQGLEMSAQGITSINSLAYRIQ